MKEVPSTYVPFFKKYNSFLAFCLFDKTRTGIRITCSACTDCKNPPSIDILLNDERKRAEFVNVQEKLLENKSYYFHYFYVDIANELLDKSLSLHFASDKGDFTTLTFDSFPIDKETNSYFAFDNSILYQEGNKLLIDKKSKNSLKRAKKRYRKGRFAKIKKGNMDAIKGEIFRLLHGFFRPFFKKEIWLISDRIEKAGDNGEVFFEYAVNNTKKNIKPCFVLGKSSPDLKRMKKIGKVLHPFTLKYKIYFLFATRNIGSQLEYHITTPITSKEYLKDILCKQKTVFLQHGITKDDLSSLYNVYDKSFDLFITATLPEHLSIVNSPAYGYNERTRLTGFARFDKLTSNQEKIIFISPTWRKYNVEDTDKYKLIDGFNDTSFFKFYNALLHNENLIEVAKKTGYSLCYFPHFMMKETKDIFGSLDPVFIDGSGISYNEMFKKCALLLTDYSSTQFDIAYLKKPVIYCQFDKEEFFSSHTYKQGYFEYERDGFGEVCYDISSCVSLLCDYMENECKIKEKYLDRIEKTFKFTDRENCARIMNEVLSLDGEN